jgi:hypothetical protein
VVSPQGVFQRLRYVGLTDNFREFLRTVFSGGNDKFTHGAKLNKFWAIGRKLFPHFVFFCLKQICLSIAE